MANSELVDLLASGATNWNRKRPENVDLSRTRLDHVQLSGANLSRVNFSGADLRYADLQEADLSDCDLRSADLRRANLSGACLCGARLNRSDLQHAKFATADLSYSDLTEVNGRKASFSKATLTQTAAYKAQFADARFTDAQMIGFDADSANFRRASFVRANLTGAWFGHSDLTGANLHSAILAESVLYDAKLAEANLTSANLSKSDLRRCTLIDAVIADSILTDSSVYGIAVWGVIGAPRDQRNLLVLNQAPNSDFRDGQPLVLAGTTNIDASGSHRHPWPSGRLGVSSVFTNESSAEVRADSLEVAQFIHLLLSREKLRSIIDTMTSKAVLILGRFTPERKVVLDAIADELRNHNLIPIIFDFERATSRDLTETIKTLAGLSLFVIADITNPGSVALELGVTVPDYQIPFVPIIHEGERPFPLFHDLKKYAWVADLLTYSSVPDLIKVFKVAVVDQAFRIHKEAIQRKAEGMRTRSVEDYLNNQEE